MEPRVGAWGMAPLRRPKNSPLRQGEKGNTNLLKFSCHVRDGINGERTPALAILDKRERVLVIERDFSNSEGSLSKRAKPRKGGSGEGKHDDSMSMHFPQRVETVPLPDGVVRVSKYTTPRRTRVLLVLPKDGSRAFVGLGSALVDASRRSSTPPSPSPPASTPAQPQRKKSFFATLQNMAFSPLKRFRSRKQKQQKEQQRRQSLPEGPLRGAVSQDAGSRVDQVEGGDPAMANVSSLPPPPQVPADEGTLLDTMAANAMQTAGYGRHRPSLLVRSTSDPKKRAAERVVLGASGSSVHAPGNVGSLDYMSLRLVQLSFGNRFYRSLFLQAFLAVCGSRKAGREIKIGASPSIRSALQGPIWLPDSATNTCMNCSAPFKLLVRRRHHCRSCGRIFCNDCTKTQVCIPELGFGDNSVRVCAECFVYIINARVSHLNGLWAGSSRRTFRTLPPLPLHFLWQVYVFNWGVQQQIRLIRGSPRRPRKCRKCTCFQEHQQQKQRQGQPPGHNSHLVLSSRAAPSNAAPPSQRHPRMDTFAEATGASGVRKPVFRSQAGGDRPSGLFASRQFMRSKGLPPPPQLESQPASSLRVSSQGSEDGSLVQSCASSESVAMSSESGADADSWGEGMMTPTHVPKRRPGADVTVGSMPFYNDMSTSLVMQWSGERAGKPARQSEGGDEAKNAQNEPAAPCTCNCHTRLARHSFGLPPPPCDDSLSASALLRRIFALIRAPPSKYAAVYAYMQRVYARALVHPVLYPRSARIRKQSQRRYVCLVRLLSQDPLLIRSLLPTSSRQRGGGSRLSLEDSQDEGVDDQSGSDSDLNSEGDEGEEGSQRALTPHSQQRRPSESAKKSVRKRPRNSVSRPQRHTSARQNAISTLSDVARNGGFPYAVRTVLWLLLSGSFDLRARAPGEEDFVSNSSGYGQLRRPAGGGRNTEREGGYFLSMWDRSLILQRLIKQSQAAEKRRKTKREKGSHPPAVECEQMTTDTHCGSVGSDNPVKDSNDNDNSSPPESEDASEEVASNISPRSMEYVQQVRKIWADVDRDLTRSIPPFVFQSPFGRASYVFPRVRRLLRVYALRNKNVGYCQGMNIVALLCILVVSPVPRLPERRRNAAPQTSQATAPPTAEGKAVAVPSPEPKGGAEDRECTTQSGGVSVSASTPQLLQTIGVASGTPPSQSVGSPKSQRLKVIRNVLSDCSRAGQKALPFPEVDNHTAMLYRYLHVDAQAFWLMCALVEVLTAFWVPASLHREQLRHESEQRMLSGLPVDEPRLIQFVQGRRTSPALGASADSNDPRSSARAESPSSPSLRPQRTPSPVVPMRRMCYYQDDLAGVQVDLAVLTDLVRKRLPHVARKLRSLGVPCASLCVDWFLCMFATILPIECVLRVGDLVVCDGALGLFRAAVTLFTVREPFILACQDPSDLQRLFAVGATRVNTPTFFNSLYLPAVRRVAKDSTGVAKDSTRVAKDGTGVAKDGTEESAGNNTPSSGTFATPRNRVCPPCRPPKPYLTSHLRSIKKLFPVLAPQNALYSALTDDFFHQQERVVEHEVNAPTTAQYGAEEMKRQAMDSAKAQLSDAGSHASQEARSQTPGNVEDVSPEVTGKTGAAGDGDGAGMLSLQLKRAFTAPPPGTEPVPSTQADSPTEKPSKVPIPLSRQHGETQSPEGKGQRRQQASARKPDGPPPINTQRFLDILQNAPFVTNITTRLISRLRIKHLRRWLRHETEQKLRAAKRDMQRAQQSSDSPKVSPNAPTVQYHTSEFVVRIRESDWTYTSPDADFDYLQQLRQKSGQSQAGDGQNTGSSGNADTGAPTIMSSSLKNEREDGLSVFGASVDFASDISSGLVGPVPPGFVPGTNSEATTVSPTAAPAFSYIYDPDLEKGRSGDEGEDREDGEDGEGNGVVLASSSDNEEVNVPPLGESLQASDGSPVQDAAPDAVFSGEHEAQHTQERTGEGDGQPAEVQGSSDNGAEGRFPYDYTGFQTPPANDDEALAAFSTPHDEVPHSESVDVAPPKTLLSRTSDYYIEVAPNQWPMMASPDVSVDVWSGRSQRQPPPDDDELDARLQEGSTKAPFLP